MAEIRVDVKDLGRDIEDLLARLNAGDEVVLERDGAAVAALAPCRGNRADDTPVASESKGLGAFLAERLKGPRWSDEEYESFIKDVETAREWLNVEPRNPWED